MKDNYWNKLNSCFVYIQGGLPTKICNNSSTMSSGSFKTIREDIEKFCGAAISIGQWNYNNEDGWFEADCNLK